MKLLAFETATEACSVALWVDGDVRERFEVAPRRHAELALPWAEQLLAEAGVAKSQLDAVAVGRGPGAFTGVRLAVAMAQGIALALDQPVIAVSTLRVLAAQARGEKGEKGSESLSKPAFSEAAVSGWESDSDPFSPSRILAAIDARMGEVYAGAFARRGDDIAALTPETVSAADAVVLPVAVGGWRGVGTGFAASEGLLARHLQSQLRHVDDTALPHAADLARLAVAAYARGEGLAPERVEPAYLRNQVALTLAEQQARR
ncbi:MAG: tRNA (adenosine(37)-N6)-threonylcarbamoyltransferase complex dimerization subunit type 1 TsaB [Pseudomonadota bacterium]|nr:tRNA (adenosine(37)-N6)-threonylcarbamoyltransferase complex dimerization subunit type 1 TsaB [Pseudomonadota bacterium]